MSNDKSHFGNKRLRSHVSFLRTKLKLLTSIQKVMCLKIIRRSRQVKILLLEFKVYFMVQPKRELIFGHPVALNFGRLSGAVNFI